AQRLADDYFKLALGNVGSGPAGVHGKEGFVRDAAPAQPRFYPSPRDLPRDIEQINAALQTEGHPGFVGRAVVKFVLRPEREQDHAEIADPDGRRLYYARAVRVSKSCLACHEDGKTATHRYRENDLAGLIAVDLPADPHGTRLVNRLAVIVAGCLA